MNDLLGFAGNVLDTPGSVLRGLLSGDAGRAVGGIMDPSQRVRMSELTGLSDDETGGMLTNAILQALMDPVALGTGLAGGLATRSAMRGATPLANRLGLGAASVSDDVAKAAAQKMALQQEAAQKLKDLEAIARKELYGQNMGRFDDMRSFIDPESLATGAARTYTRPDPELARAMAAGGLGEMSGDTLTVTGGLKRTLSNADKKGSPGVPPPFAQPVSGRGQNLVPREGVPVPDAATMPTFEELDALKRASVSANNSVVRQLPGGKTQAVGASSIHGPDPFRRAALERTMDARIPTQQVPGYLMQNMDDVDSVLLEALQRQDAIEKARDLYRMMGMVGGAGAAGGIGGTMMFGG